MPDILEANSLENYMAFYVGPSGAGKSVAIASFMEKGPVFFFDVDGRMASVANWYRRRGLRKGMLSYERVTAVNLFEMTNKLNNFANGYCDYKVIVVDSFTALTITAVMFSLKRRQMKGGDSAPSMTKGEMIIPDWDEYKGETVCVTQWLELCTTLVAKGITVIWTGHPIVSTKIEKTEDGKAKYGKQVKYSAYGEKSSSLIPIYFNETYYFTTKWSFEFQEWRRVCITSPVEDIVAKNSLSLPSEIDWTAKEVTDPSFYQILSREVENNKYVEPVR